MCLGNSWSVFGEVHVWYFITFQEEHRVFFWDLHYWGPLVLVIFTWFLSLCWWQFWHNKTHTKLFFFFIDIYKHEKVETIVFQVVVSRAHPRTVLALGRTLRDAQCCWLECRRGQPHVKSAGDGFATTSAFWEVPAAAELGICAWHRHSRQGALRMYMRQGKA